jgi:anti-sigma regulatory factor (Ser/Thr protein kinase)
MQLSIAANAEQVTDAVITVQRALLAHGVAAGMVGRIELTLAEALNNVAGSA